MIKTLLYAVAIVCLTTACSSSPSHSNVYVAPQATAGGPPSHAPAHGYRNKEHKQRYKGIDLVFDTGLGVYVVVDMADGDSSAVLAQALADPEPEIREAAVFALAEVGDETSVHLIRQALSDPDRDVREVAEEMLMVLDDGGL